MVLTFNTGFIKSSSNNKHGDDKEGDVVTSRKAIAKNYLFGWFAVDVVAVFPFELLLVGGGSDRYYICFSLFLLPTKHGCKCLYL